LEAVQNRHLLIIYSFAEQMNDLFETVMTLREPKAKPFQMLMNSSETMNSRTRKRRRRKMRILSCCSSSGN
jgi:hypothetical protein